MNRVEFMRKLDELLKDVPVSEREEAITYYNDYFNDAGVENEQEVIESLGSPERVADTIKAGLGGREIDGEFTEIGYQDAKSNEKEEMVVPGQEAEQGETSEGSTQRNAQDNTQYKEKRKDYSKQRPNENKLLRVILYVLIAVLLCPLWMPLAGGLFGILVAVLAVIGVCALMIVLLPFIVMVVGMALLISGVFTFVVGIVELFTTPFAAVGMMGIGLLLCGGGLLATLLGSWCLVKIVPPMIRGFVNLCRKPFTRKGAERA